MTAEIMNMTALPINDNATPLNPGVGTADRNLSLGPILEKYWQALKRRYLLIGVIIAAFLVAAVVITMLTTPQYTAVTKVQISRPQKNVVDVREASQDNNFYDSEFYETQYALLRLRTLAERVATKMNLAEQDDFFNAHGVDVSGLGTGKSGLASSNRAKRQDIAVGLLLSHIRIEPVKYSSLVNISYTCNSASWAALIANAWPKEFVAAAMDRGVDSTADARSELERRLQDMRLKLEDSERQLLGFSNSHNMITLGVTRDANGKTEEPRTLVASNLESVNEELIHARSDRVAAESRLGTGSTNSDALQSTALGSLRTKRADLVAERERLLVQYEPAYPTVRAVQRSIDGIDAAIAQEYSRYGSAQRSKYVEARQREQKISAQVDALKAEYLSQRNNTVEYSILQRDVDTNRQLYDALLQRYKEVGLAGTIATNNVAILDDAKTPGGPSAPSLPRNLAAALVAALLLCGLVVFVLEQIDEVIRDPAEIEPLLQVPLLGSVPLIDGTPGDELQDPKSNLAEAYFSIQSVMALTTNHGFPKTLEVTSTKPGEGKSITALALATSLGRTGKSVLLVDADMRKPSIHRLTGSENTHGLSNMLAGDNEFHPYLQTIEFKGVTILPSGPLPPSAAELLNSVRLEQVIAMMLKEFDHVIFDAPPLLGLADSQLLCRAVEGAVFVVEAQETSTRAIQAAMQRLRVGTNHVFGVVLTKLDYSKFGSRSDNVYSYDYGNK